MCSWCKLGVLSGISKTLNTCRKGEIPKLLEGSMYCFALQFPSGNNIQAERGYQLSAAGSPRQTAAVSAWIICTLCVQRRLRYPHYIGHMPEIQMHQSYCAHASTLLCIVQAIFALHLQKVRCIQHTQDSLHSTHTHMGVGHFNKWSSSFCYGL